MADSLRRFERPGAELEHPPTFTPPEIRVGPRQWDPYYGLRFGPRVRVVIGVALLGPPALLVLLGLLIMVAEEGRSRAAGFVFLMMVVPFVPLARRIVADLWLPRH